MSGKLFVFSGCSGVGKSTVLKQIMEKYPNARFSVSATTRAMRPGEVEGKSYFFVTREAFEEMIRDNDLLEYNVYGDNYYGTPVKPLLSMLADGYDIVLDIEPHGAFNVRARYPQAKLIFIAPPSLEELRHRLVTRGDTAPEQIEKRMAQAAWEMEQKDKYDHVVVNDQLDQCVRQVCDIMEQ